MMQMKVNVCLFQISVAEKIYIYITHPPRAKKNATDLDTNFLGPAVIGTT